VICSSLFGSMMIAVVAGAATGGLLFLLQMLIPPAPKGKECAPWQSKDAQQAATLVATGLVSAGVTVREHFKLRSRNQKTLAPKRALTKDAPTQTSATGLSHRETPIQRKPRPNVFTGVLGAIAVIVVWQWRRLRKQLTTRKVPQATVILQPSAESAVVQATEESSAESMPSIEPELSPVTTPRNTTPLEVPMQSPSPPTERVVESSDLEQAPRPNFTGAIESPDAKHAPRPAKGIIESSDAEDEPRLSKGGVQSPDAKCAPRPTTRAVESPDAKCAPRPATGAVESPDAKCAPRPAVQSPDAKSAPREKASPTKVNMTAKQNLKPAGSKRLIDFHVLHEPSSDDEAGNTDEGPAIKNLISKFNKKDARTPNTAGSKNRKGGDSTWVRKATAQ